MKRIEILIAHEEFCKIWQASDGRWKTKIPDATKKGGYRLIAKSSKENLENAIIEHYRALEAEKKKDSTTLATLYPLWKEQQVNKGRSSRTIRRYDDMWKKYFENESIVSRDITKLTVAELENFINKLSSCKKGCRKSYQNQKWDSWCIPIQLCERVNWNNSQLAHKTPYHKRIPFCKRAWWTTLFFRFCLSHRELL